MEKLKAVWAKVIAFGNRQWWGIKVFVWIALAFLALVSLTYFLFFRKGGSKKFKKK